MEKREALMDQYAHGYDLIQEALKKFPSEMWHFRMEDDSWSIHDIVIHLADSELVGYTRCRKIIAENGTELSGYDQNRWCTELQYEEHDANEALELFRQLRKMNATLLKNTPEIVWNTHAAFHPDIGSMTLDDWLVIYTHHPQIHIEQMEKIHEAWKLQKK